jgi:hypothetical protein
MHCSYASVCHFRRARYVGQAACLFDKAYDEKHRPWLMLSVVPRRAVADA